MKPVSVFLRTAFNYDRDAASNESALECRDPSLTKQEFLKDADINEIVRRFNLTGQLPQGVHPPTFGDFDEVFDFQTAMNAIAVARQSFEAMPAEVRARFLNDPQLFVEFCSDESNLPEMRKMGLAVPAEASPPDDAKESPSGDSGASGGGSSGSK